MLYLDANFAGEFTECETEERSEWLYDENINRRVRKSWNVFDFNKLSSSGKILRRRPGRFRSRDVDLVLTKSRREHNEDIVDFTNDIQFQDDHGGEENEHFPNAHKYVRKIPGILQSLLNLAQKFHERCP